MVADPRGRFTPRVSSPIPERDCFVIFDDARCRWGASWHSVPEFDSTQGLQQA